MVKKISDNKFIICKKCNQKINNCKKIRSCKIHNIIIKKNGFIYCKDCGDKNKSFTGLECFHQAK
jgi:RNA polymerase-binding transcription factor DksA